MVRSHILTVSPNPRAAGRAASHLDVHSIASTARPGVAPRGHRDTRRPVSACTLHPAPAPPRGLFSNAWSKPLVIGPHVLRAAGCCCCKTTKTTRTLLHHLWHSRDDEHYLPPWSNDLAGKQCQWMGSMLCKAWNLCTAADSTPRSVLRTICAHATACCMHKVSYVVGKQTQDAARCELLITRARVISRHFIGGMACL